MRDLDLDLHLQLQQLPLVVSRQAAPLHSGSLCVGSGLLPKVVNASQFKVQIVQNEPAAASILPHALRLAGPSFSCSMRLLTTQ